MCLSSMGYCVLVVHGLNRLYSVASRWGAAALTVSMLVVLLLFSWKTVQQNEIWLSREALFRSVHIQFLLGRSRINPTGNGSRRSQFPSPDLICFICHFKLVELDLPEFLAKNFLFYHIYTM